MARDVIGQIRGAFGLDDSKDQEPKENDSQRRYREMKEREAEGVHEFADGGMVESEKLQKLKALLRMMGK